MTEESPRYPDNRLARRASFNRVAISYTAARPSYSDQLVADLVQRCRIGRGSTLLEVGAGTGQLTIPLAETGASIIAVELGQDLARIAQERLSAYPNVKVIVADFDSWPVPASAFDVVVAATALHWLDPRTRMARCRSAMKPGGLLAVIETRWGVRVDGNDPFFDASQACYSRWDPDHDPGYGQPTPEEVVTIRSEIENSGLYGEVEHRRYVVERSYTRRQFIELINTYSTVQSWPDDQRNRFLQCMANLIDEEFGGQIQRSDLYDLCIANAE